MEDCEPELKRLGFTPWIVRLGQSSTLREHRELWRLAGTLRERDILLLDGAEQLSWWSWGWVRWLSRRAGGLLISCHGPGRYPTLLKCQVSPELFKSLVSELNEEPEQRLGELFEKHGGNLREALRDLYDLNQDL